MIKNLRETTPIDVSGDELDVIFINFLIAYKHDNGGYQKREIC